MGVPFNLGGFKWNHNTSLGPSTFLLSLFPFELGMVPRLSPSLDGALRKPGKFISSLSVDHRFGNSLFSLRSGPLICWPEGGGLSPPSSERRI